MPVVSFSAKDLLRGKVVLPGWYRCRIDEIGEKPSKDNLSTNYPAEATILYNAQDKTTEFAGIPLDWNFNSKAIGFAVGFLEALGVQVTPGQRIELKAAEGKEIDIFIENDLWQGRQVNRVNHKYKKAE